jgi:medium-chain acyl-[acyl-carrier-protein] hydrolase
MASDPWIARPRPNARARLRLFCFPYAGGGASLFRTWPQELAAEIEVCAVQPPGREHRLIEAPFTRLAPLVEALAEVLQPYFTVPFAFFGHSMGALISFELARCLRDQGGEGPMHLFVSGCRAPQLPDPDPPIHELPEDEFVAELVHLKGTPEGVMKDKELMELLLPVLRADFAICEKYLYQPGEPLDCPISAFGGLEDEEIGWDGVAAWEEQTRGAFTLRMVPGGHFFLHNARQLVLPAVAQELRAYLQGVPAVGAEQFETI